ncbi:MAG: ATP-binding protein [Rubrivivax sp.]|nr:ATP-binding protein [Rubrivivax sp.]
MANPLDPTLTAALRRRLALQLMTGRAFQIKTPATVEYLKATHNWLSMGVQGGYVHARSRTGKTFGTRWVLGSLPVLLDCAIPYLEIPLRDQVYDSERAFFQFMLQCACHPLYAKGSSGDKRDRLSRWLLARARRSRIGTVVLVIDEAQLLSDHHFQWLLDISNEIEAGGYRLFCLLVGQEPLHARAQNMTRYAEFEPIVARFLICHHELSAMRTEQDLSMCLEQFDRTLYPVESGKTFVENFVPEAWAQDFRLASCAPAFFSAFRSQAPVEKDAQELDIPMAYLVMALLQFLNAVAGFDSPTALVPQDTARRAVENTNYHLFMNARAAQADSVGESSSAARRRR